MNIKRVTPVIFAVGLGLLALIGLLIPLPAVNDILLNWVSFIAAAALLIGVLNLLSVHIRRATQERNPYSGILTVSMVAVFVFAITDALGLTQNLVEAVFTWVQSPLEAALASLLAFFLLLAGFRLLKRERTVWSLLFVATAVLVLIGSVLPTLTILPARLGVWAGLMQRFVQEVAVTAGMRGLLLGIALGTITLSVRILLGTEQPYNK